jgi:hypothetical protein
MPMTGRGPGSSKPERQPAPRSARVGLVRVKVLRAAELEVMAWHFAVLGGIDGYPVCAPAGDEGRGSCSSRAPQLCWPIGRLRSSSADVWASC